MLQHNGASTWASVGDGGAAHSSTARNPDLVELGIDERDPLAAYVPRIGNLVMMSVFTTATRIDMSLAGLAGLLPGARVNEQSYPRILLRVVTRDRGTVCRMVFRAPVTANMRATAVGRARVENNGGVTLGRVVAAGALNRRQICEALDTLQHMLTSVLGTAVAYIPPVVCNLVVHAATQSAIDLKKVAAQVEDAVYLPETFPGLHLVVYKRDTGQRVAACNIFPLGSIVSLGQPDEVRAVQSLRVILAVLQFAQQGSTPDEYMVRGGTWYRDAQVPSDTGVYDKHALEELMLEAAKLHEGLDA